MPKFAQTALSDDHIRATGGLVLGVALFVAWVLVVLLR